MNLNLGLESLNGSSNSAVIPFTPASMIEMANASEAITNLMQSLENYYDAARNAMLVKKAVKQYGKTQSIVALIGQEGLAAAQSFSMEGFWEKIKAGLIAIWEKIKEWWGRFWGMFFSVENKLSSFVSELDNSSKRLDHPVEFDAPDYKLVVSKAKQLSNTITKLKTASASINKENVLDTLVDELKKYDVRQEGNVVSNDRSTGKIIHYRFTAKNDVKTVAKALLDDVIKAHKNSKRDIDEYTKKFLDNIKGMKVTASHGTAGVSGDVYGAGATGARSAGDETTSNEQDIGVKIVKQSAKLNNSGVAAVLKDATTIAVKTMAHTRLVG